jgi:phosphate transport system substrate-binding protein
MNSIFLARCVAVIGRYGLLFCLFGLLLVSCGTKSSSKTAKGKTTVQIKGSDTMVNVEQAWAEEYKILMPGVNIEVSGGGSGVGIAALEKGNIDIAAASRNMKKEEFEQTQKNTGKAPKEYIVGFDALAVFIHKDNPLRNISLEQLAGIFIEDGQITRWSQLGVTIPGVKDDRIVLVSRQSSSGTYSFFRERVLHKKDFRLGSLDMNGSKEVVELVSNTKTAIGYSGMGYATEDVIMLNVSKHPGDTAVSPTLENTLAKKYPLARSLQFYTLGEPAGETKNFLDWVLSKAGQDIVKQTGYVPIAASDLSAGAEGPLQLTGRETR